MEKPTVPFLNGKTRELSTGPCSIEKVENHQGLPSGIDLMKVNDLICFTVWETNMTMENHHSLSFTVGTSTISMVHF